MRTTLTVEDPLLERLRNTAHETQRPFKDVVNEALALGLEAMAQPARVTPVRIKPARMGNTLHAAGVQKALVLAATLEDEALLAKMGLGK